MCCYHSFMAKSVDIQIEATRLRELLDYDTETGIFRWRCNRSNVKAGSVAGCPAPTGYTVIRLFKRLHLAHRLAWLHHHGENPPELIDHINGIKTDNRIANLRPSDKVSNGQNRRTCQTNNKSSGFLGVALIPHTGKYTAYINVRGKRKYMGLFEKKEDAYAAYLNEKRRLHQGSTI